MELISSILLLLFFSFTFFQALRSLSARSSRATLQRLPPGPNPLPIIGNLLQLGKKPHKSLAKLAKVHGPIMALKLGQLTTVVVSSVDMAEAVLLTHDQVLSNRTIPDAVSALNHDKYSLPFMAVSQRWRNLRRICNNQLFAGRILDSSQQLRRKKVQELFSDIHESSLTGEAVDIGRAAFMTAINLLSNTIFSVDMVQTNTAGEFREIVSNILKVGGRPNLADYFPILKKVDPQGIRRRVSIYAKKMMDIFHGLIDQRLRMREKTSFASDDDLLDVLLNISEESSEEMDQTKIEHLSLDLFVAGTDTTSSTVEWAMAELLHNPKAMSKAKAELEQTIGKGKPVEETDIAELPYLQAVLKETFRLHPPVPFLLPRKAEEGVEINGYTVPKGAQVLVNVWAIGRDPNTWERANLFMPERFLGSDIVVKGRNFELTPFGAGRRLCPGLPLAMRMVPLMLGTLINSFDWKLEGGMKAEEEMDMEDRFGITLQKAQPVRAVPVRVNN